MSWLDLHMHSSCSYDGEVPPTDLMDLCSRKNIKTVALTDHNTVRGLEYAAGEARKLGLEFITGVELDCGIQGKYLHLLGYGITPGKAFFHIESEVYQELSSIAERRMAMVEKLGIVFDKDKVRDKSVKGIITAELIAEVAMKDPRNVDNPLLRPYFTGGIKSKNPYASFFWDYFAQGKAAHIPLSYISLDEAVRVIHDNGGIAVLAHPGQSIGTDEEIFNAILSQGIDGIEVYSSYHDEKTTCFYEEKADSLGLLKTIGSDFHGKIKPAIVPGSADCGYDEIEIYHRLKEALA